MKMKYNEPVECCNRCKSLYLVNDDKINVYCKHCGHANDVEVFEDIQQYLDRYGYLWNAENTTS